jgi:hypothetical protein
MPGPIRRWEEPGCGPEVIADVTTDMCRRVNNKMKEESNFKKAYNGLCYAMQVYIVRDCVLHRP